MRFSSWKALAFTSILILIVATPTVAQQTAAPAMSVCQARRTIVTEMQRVGMWSYGDALLSLPSGVTFNVGEFEFHAEPGNYKKVFPRGTYKIDLKTLGEVTAYYEQNYGDNYKLRVNGRYPLYGNFMWLTEGHVRKNLSNASILGFLGWQENANAQAFADAMNALRFYAHNYDPSQGMPVACFADKDEQARIWAEFQKRAAAWRALPAKPPLTDDVNKHWLLAEDELKEKHFDAALREYEAALEIDPRWPVGQFNAAMLSGELKNYDDAVWHMRCYLELTPNAPDAQSAHDQMLLWQARAEQQGNAK